MAYRGNYILSSDSHYTQDVEEGKTKADTINSYLEEGDFPDKDIQDVEEGKSEADTMNSYLEEGNSHDKDTREC